MPGYIIYPATSKEDFKSILKNNTDDIVYFYYEIYDDTLLSQNLRIYTLQGGSWTLIHEQTITQMSGIISITQPIGLQVGENTVKTTINDKEEETIYVGILVQDISTSNGFINFNFMDETPVNGRITLIHKKGYILTRQYTENSIRIPNDYHDYIIEVYAPINENEFYYYIAELKDIVSNPQTTYNISLHKIRQAIIKITIPYNKAKQIALRTPQSQLITYTETTLGKQKTTPYIVNAISGYLKTYFGYPITNYEYNEETDEITIYYTVKTGLMGLILTFIFLLIVVFKFGGQIKDLLQAITIKTTAQAQTIEKINQTLEFTQETCTEARQKILNDPTLSNEEKVKRLDELNARCTSLTKDLTTQQETQKEDLTETMKKVLIITITIIILITLLRR